MLALTASLVAGIGGWPARLIAQPRPDASATSEERIVDLLRRPTWSGLRVTYWGVTRRDTPLVAWHDSIVTRSAHVRTRVLLIGGVGGDLESVRLVRSAVEWLGRTEAGNRRRARYEILAVPCANPDGAADGTGPDNGVGGRVERGYPPAGPAYLSRQGAEAAYLWRWLGMTAPDVVVVVRPGAAAGCVMPALMGNDPDVPVDLRDSWRRLADHLHADQTSLAEDDLVAALVRGKPAGVGAIPALRLDVVPRDADVWLERLLSALDASHLAQASPAHLELNRRESRSAREIAEQLAEHYGHELKQVEYIPALALVGRIRLAELTGQTRHRAEVERIVAPLVEGRQASRPMTGSGQSGHLIFSVLAEHATVETRPRYVALVRVAADQMFDERGEMREAMPYHLEMSDALFMGGPILAAAGRWTGEEKYREGCLRHLRFMRRLVLREDGLYRHSPLDEAAWGRGNGFPALGLALCVQEFPEDDPRRGELLTMLQTHLRALLPHQDDDGMWHQVIDHPESYRELSCTCMIGWALARGLRGGWLEREKFELPARRAWHAVRRRIASDGQLVDVCTGTGKQSSLRAYFDREALLGRDPRGGAMALLFATEMALAP